MHLWNPHHHRETVSMEHWCHRSCDTPWQSDFAILAHLRNMLSRPLNTLPSIWNLPVENTLPIAENKQNFDDAVSLTLAPWALACQTQHEWAGYEKFILELLTHPTHLESSIKELSTYSFFFPGRLYWKRKQTGNVCHLSWDLVLREGDTVLICRTLVGSIHVDINKISKEGQYSWIVASCGPPPGEDNVCQVWRISDGTQHPAHGSCGRDFV